MQSIPDPDSFRDTIATVDGSGKRQWIYPQRQGGRYYDKRSLVSYMFILLFLGLPFIRLHGRPLLLLDILNREFIIFGAIFRPQDLFLFALALLAFMVFIVLFTAIFGRLFCGWVCPQTVFMEMIFRKIEYWIEGNAQQQKMLNAAPWSTEKLYKKGAKISLFFILSFMISNFFLSYFIGMDELLRIASEPLEQHRGGFIAILIFTGIFFFVYTWFREQVCIVVCPYGRLQSVLLDRNSIVVAYDYIRGEPRGKVKKNEEAASKGDCIDCNLCVRVCPTGIDIRHGTQLECINCTACMDACDEIMDKVHKPKGLIRYASENGIAKGEKLRITPRIMAYSAILLLLVTGLSLAIGLRSDTQTSILRAPGVMYQEVGSDSISNLYNFKILNKSHDMLRLGIRLVQQQGEIRQIGGDSQVQVPGGGIREGSFFVVLHRRDISQRKNKIAFEVYDASGTVESCHSVFLGPLR